MNPVDRSSGIPTDDGDHLSPPKISDRMEDMRLLARELSVTTSEIERWIKAINNFSAAIKDRKMLNDLITFLYGLQKGDPDKNKQSKSGSSAPKKDSNKPQEKSTPHQPVSRDGDSLYDLINTPNFTQIVEKVMAKKKRK